MPIQTLRINHFRNLTAIELNPSSHLNIIHGQNGSGKTSLLEAIYYLSLGRSFKTSQAACLIQIQQQAFSLYIQILNEVKREIRLGIERAHSGKNRLRMDDHDAATIAAFAAHLPVRIIHSQSHQLFESGPSHRRKYLDWGLFYYHPAFLNCWRQYERILKQRNAVLQRNRSKKELDSWTDELVKYAEIFNQYRMDYIAALMPVLNDVINMMPLLPPITINYQPGWSTESTLHDIFQKHYGEEIRLGFTQYGPHRADLCFSAHNAPVKHILSRGQQKLLICAMILSQGKLLEQQVNHPLVYLVDDLPAELDKESRSSLLSLIHQQSSQVFVTAITAQNIDELLDHDTCSVKMFHVEHGHIVEE